MNIRIILPCLLCLPWFAHAGPRTSTNYSVATDTVDVAGRRTASASYTNDASAGGIGGTSTAPSAEVVKHSYIGQLYDATGLTLTAPFLTVNETATLQLAASLALDDSTTLAVPATSVTWSVLSGPLAGISVSGLVTAAAVYQNTAATAQGAHAGITGTLGLTVINTLPDNFGTYAGDTIADDWQVQYFGVNNPNAGPLLDPDGDTFDNLFEYHACLVPTDPLSVFSMSIADAPGGSHAVTFSPRLAGCTYSLLGSNDLNLWAPVSGAVTDAGTTRTILDPSGTGARRFYSISVQRD